jgi:hypothetical protein
MRFCAQKIYFNKFNREKLFTVFLFFVHSLSLIKGSIYLTDKTKSGIINQYLWKCVFFGDKDERERNAKS